MTAQAIGGFTARQFAVKVAPFVVIALAGLAVRTPAAAAYPFAALLLFAWIVADTMMLSLIARTSGKPPRHAVLGVLAGASVTVGLVSPPALREILLATPILMAAMAVTIVAHVAWAMLRAKRVLTAEREGTDNRWIAAASTLLPPALVRLAAAELKILHMAFFRWGGSGDVPARCRAFTYHKHLAPMCATLLILSAIEIAVYHVFVGHWSRTAAVVMFIVSDVGLIYLIGVIKSFRFRPVLVTPDGICVRAGLLIDQFVPIEAIAGIETNFAGESIRHPTTLNASLMAWPNILLRLDQPIHRRSLLQKQRRFDAIAFRLDDPEPFVRLLQWRLESKVG